VCGRFTLTSTPEELARRFELDEVPSFSPRYNIAPGQDVLAVRLESGRRRARSLRWGLVPGWARDPSVGSRMINARVESVTTRSAFRDAVRARRCLVPADGFFEWTERAGIRQPYYAKLPDGPFAFAGLWERWRGDDERSLESCTLLTTDAVPALREVHDRMPVVVAPADHAAWLAADGGDARELLDQVLARSPAAWRLHPVSTRVNRADREGEQCIAPVPEPPRQEALF
jgi:putative SOS response-associated peptidase YedK